MMAIARNTTIAEEDSRVLFRDDHTDLMEPKTRQVFEIVNYVVLCSLVAIFGMATNSINMVVFCKQGFQTVTNISFQALAVSDLCCLSAVLWFSICMNPLLTPYSCPLALREIHSLTAGWPHVTFGRITSWITTFITAERCLCITFPLTVKRIITPRRTLGTLVSIYLLNIISVFPVYITAHFDYKFYPDLNLTLLGLLATNNNVQAESLVFLIHANSILVSVFCVAVLTSVLVIRLQQASKWRHSSSSLKDQGSISHKDKKTTRIVVMISSLLIATYTPGIILSLATFSEPKFGIFGVYRNLFMATWSFCFLLNSINSSFNIFLYYNMSSKFRNTLSLMCRGADKDD